MARSHGSTLLAQTNLPQDMIAERCGVSQVAVSYWFSGTSKPRGPKRAIIAEAWGVPPTSWDEPPPDVTLAPLLAAPAPAPPPAAAPARFDPFAGIEFEPEVEPEVEPGRAVAGVVTSVGSEGVRVELGAPVSALPPSNEAATVPPPAARILDRAGRLEAMIDRMLTKIESSGTNLALGDVRMAKTCADTLNALAKLRGENEIGPKFLRGAFWSSIKEALRRGLQGHPEAAAQVAREIGRVEIAYLSGEPEDA